MKCVKYLILTALWMGLVLAPSPAWPAPIPTSQLQYYEPQNLLTNPGFESLTTAWTKSGGTFATTATSGEGNFAAVFTPSAGSQTLTSTQYTIPTGLYGQRCVAKVFYKTTEATNLYSFLVIDGSVVTQASSTLASSSTFTVAYLRFACPTSGTLAVRIAANAVAPAAAITVDSFYLGFAGAPSANRFCTTAVNNPGIGNTTLTATCPANTFAVGGGCGTDSAGTGALRWSQPSPQPVNGDAVTANTGWQCRMTTSVNIIAYATCCPY